MGHGPRFGNTVTLSATALLTRRSPLRSTLAGAVSLLSVSERSAAGCFGLFMSVCSPRHTPRCAGTRCPAHLSAAVHGEARAPLWQGSTRASESGRELERKEEAESLNLKRILLYEIASQISIL